ncbi:MAG: HAD family hydrolase [Alphaproteobacteria bacterium]|nr:HAD family hydrolase [Alphaproteobacteria bacterium]
MKINNKNQFTKLPDAILFDLDNTLYPYQPAHQAGMAAMRTKLMQECNINASNFDKLFAEARAQVKAQLGLVASSHSRLLYAQRMIENMGLRSQILLALNAEQSYWHHFLQHAILFPHVKELLDDLRLLAIPAAIVTDLTCQIQFRKIIYFGLEHYFDYITTSEEVIYDKPNPNIFNLALQKLTLSSADEHIVWMIGDNPTNDIQGARDAIQAVTIQKIHDKVTIGTGKQAPDASFKDYQQLRKFITQKKS